MLKFLTSLSFMYLSVVIVLLIYGWSYYRGFIANGIQRRRFPIVFTIVALICAGFLYINIHAPLSLKTFSNLDHFFLQHDGFRVNGKMSLGRSDTAHFPAASFSEFQLEK